MRQQHWEITWNNAQLKTLCDPWHSVGGFTKLPSIKYTYIRDNVCFWVTAGIGDVEDSLNARLALLRCFLEHRQLDIRPRGRHSLPEALQWMARVTSVGVMGILLESNYDETGQRPRIRDRWRKLSVVRVGLVHTFKLLLEYGRKQDLDINMSAISADFALHHHLRISSAWTEAVQAIFPQNLVGVMDYETKLGTSPGPTALENERPSTEHDLGAESDWETEEDSDFEYNPQLDAEKYPVLEKPQSYWDRLSVDYDENYCPSLETFVSFWLGSGSQ